ncbi:MAG: RDD family protein [Halieaceae bacterium]|nr:RDD family protein [Halieaceae bacterium]
MTHAVLWRHVVAMIYDTLLIVPLLMAATAGLLALHRFNGGAETPLPPWQVQASGLIVTAFFYTIFWRKSGQTLGMQAWRIKLVGADGQAVSGSQILRRLISVPLSMLPAGLGYWWCLWDPERKSWHDRLSGTRLIMLPKKS